MTDPLFEDPWPLEDPNPVPMRRREPYTEGHMAGLLRSRYPTRGVGNGPRWITARGVRSHAGFDARRTCDFIALSTWPSDGLNLHGHEIKVSRSDWLRELKDTDKSAEFIRHCDYWWLVVPWADIIKPGELPDGWGVLAGTTRLRQVTPAPRLTPLAGRHPAGYRIPDDRATPRPFLVALLRAVAAEARRDTTLP